MSSMSYSVASVSSFRALNSTGSPLKSLEHLKGFGCTNLSFPLTCPKVERGSLKGLKVQATYSDGERSSNANAFVGGFVLGGLIVGTLGCVYAPQISRALSGTDGKEIMKKLPKFIYDEDKALEKTRKVLAKKIAQLNSAIDDISTQLRPEDSLNGVIGDVDEVESAT
ncbi:hypothetical protein SAY87_010741 [Trapa incisa]|uniref:Uncharacterized protein n=2 Tax=Trapa TaxID=22665 RepID=A0AAN7MDF0_TRANT|nr:hypothetical protein SAY87_010741 [Trapa incisa]KAK4794725.1 hypothetical protein SAY86_012719 [Trapa natans]